MSFVLAAALLGAAAPADAFALVIGSNQSVDEQLEPLRYADDDAARWSELLHALGAQVVVLARPDENTRALHPKLEARAPTRAELDAAVSELGAKVAQARAQGRSTALFVTYAGHGNVKDGEGYLTLEDARLSAQELVDALFAKVGADVSHFIVDACYSSFLASGRGPSGQRQQASGFSKLTSQFEAANVGLVLSTGSAKESHEWEGFQAGVFSHEVRSALYGGADADGDGAVSYRELGAFVERANQAIANEKYRPDVYVLPPRSTRTLLQLAGRPARQLVIDGARAAHYVLEDGRGVRLADVHNPSGEAVRLYLPDADRLYLKRTSDSREFVLPAQGRTVELASLAAAPPRVGTRGAAHDAFSLTFSQPFGLSTVRDFRERQLTGVSATSGSAGWRRPLGFGGLALGVVGLAVGLGFTLDGALSRGRDTAALSNADALALNARIAADNTGMGVGYAVGAALLAVGLLVLLWPEDSR